MQSCDSLVYIKQYCIVLYIIAQNFIPSQFYIKLWVDDAGFFAIQNTLEEGYRNNSAVRALFALSEDPGSFLSTHMVAHSHP